MSTPSQTQIKERKQAKRQRNEQRNQLIKTLFALHENKTSAHGKMRLKRFLKENPGLNYWNEKIERSFSHVGGELVLTLRGTNLSSLAGCQRFFDEMGYYR